LFPNFIASHLPPSGLIATPPTFPALYLSDVLATSYNAVKDTAVYPDDTVAVFGAGPIGQMVGVFALREGAGRVIFLDTEPRLSFVRSRTAAADLEGGRVEFVDYKELAAGSVVARLKDMCGGRGPDVAIECAAGEYAKGWMHWVEMALGAETDTFAPDIYLSFAGIYW
jgi:threonine dehydrogenase-like Zn-dependent dehydrogenase